MIDNMRRRSERLGYRVGLAGNALFLAGSVLYLNDGATRMGTWLFVAGSALALLATLLPQMIHIWFCPDDDSEGSSPARPEALLAAA